MNGLVDSKQDYENILMMLCKKINKELKKYKKEIKKY